MNAIGLPTLYYTSTKPGNEGTKMSYKLFIFGHEGKSSIGITHTYIDKDQIPTEIGVDLGECGYREAYLYGQALWDYVAQLGGMTSIEMHNKKNNRERSI